MIQHIQIIHNNFRASLLCKLLVIPFTQPLPTRSHCAKAPSNFRGVFTSSTTFVLGGCIVRQENTTFYLGFCPATNLLLLTHDILVLHVIWTTCRLLQCRLRVIFLERNPRDTILRHVVVTSTNYITAKPLAYTQEAQGIGRCVCPLAKEDQVIRFMPHRHVTEGTNLHFDI